MLSPLLQARQGHLWTHHFRTNGRSQPSLQKSPGITSAIRSASVHRAPVRGRGSPQTVLHRDLGGQDPLLGLFPMSGAACRLGGTTMTRSPSGWAGAAWCGGSSARRAGHVHHKGMLLDRRAGRTSGRHREGVQGALATQVQGPSHPPSCPRTLAHCTPSAPLSPPGP